MPVVSGRQMLTWLDGRNTSSFGSLSWSGGALSFTVVAGTGANGLQAMLPMVSNAGTLTTVKRNGVSVSFTAETIKGVAYAIFPAVAGPYVATYASDNTPPVISNVTAAPSFGTAAISWTTNEPADSLVSYGIAANALTLSATAAAFVTAHSLTLSGLTPNTLYFYRVTSKDTAN